MSIPVLLAPVVSFFLKASVIKFFVVSFIVAAMAVLVPLVMELLGAASLAGLLNTAFGGLAPSMWYFIDLFQFSYGLPMLITAYVSRFLIRRLPIVG